MHVAYTSAIDNLLHINSQFYMEKHTKKRQINPHEFTKHSDRHELSRDKLKIQIKKILCIEFANFRIHMRFQMPPLQYLMDDNKQKKWMVKIQLILILIFLSTLKMILHAHPRRGRRKVK